jgi:DNA-directed RNA polymerase specialized sigma24 family protein
VVSSAEQPSSELVVARRGRRAIEASVGARADFVARSLRNLGVDDSHIDAAVQKVFLLALREVGPSAIDDEACLFRAASSVAAQARRRWPRRAQAASSPRARLDSMLDALPEDAREVFVLCTIEQRDVAGAATILGQQTAWARTRLHRAQQAYSARLGAASGAADHDGDTLLQAGRDVVASPQAKQRSLHAVDAVTRTSLLGRVSLLFSQLSLAVFLALLLALAAGLYWLLHTRP